MNFNKAVISGRLTGDPELRTTSNGSPVCDFGLAVNREGRTDKATGEVKTETLFLDCVAWGRHAEVVSLMRKGDPVLLEGRLVMDTWESKDGQKRTKVKVSADLVIPLGVTEPAPLAVTKAPARPARKDVESESW